MLVFQVTTNEEVFVFGDTDLYDSIIDNQSG
jgi:hypothetical protein